MTNYQYLAVVSSVSSWSLLIIASLSELQGVRPWVVVGLYLIAGVQISLHIFWHYKALGEKS